MGYIPGLSQSSQVFSLDTANGEQIDKQIQGKKLMEYGDRIYIAGHRGLVGSALLRALKQRGYRNLLTLTHAELDLTRQEAVEHGSITRLSKPRN